MSTLVDLRLTPETIGNKTYQIPLYQRLFEWDSERITQLLNDQKNSQRIRHIMLGCLLQLLKMIWLTVSNVSL